MNVYVDELNSLFFLNGCLFKKIVDIPINKVSLENSEIIEENSLIIVDFVKLFVRTKKFSENIDFFTKIKKTRNKKILIIHDYKSMKDKEDLDFFFNFLKKDLRISKLNIYFVTQLYIDILVLEKYLLRNNIWNFDTWLHQLFQNLYIEEPYFSDVRNLKPKKFSVFCKRFEQSRFNIFCDLISNNLLPEFNYTFAAHINGHTNEKNFNYFIDEKYNFCKNEIIEWTKGIPYEVSANSKDIFFPQSLEQYFINSKINLVIETDPYNYLGDSFISEKIYKAIFYKKPFLLISQPKTLSALRLEGFKTFSPFFNEDYDNIASYNERVDFIINEIKRLCKLPTDIFYQTVTDMEHIVNYNYEVFIKKATTLTPENFKISNLLLNKDV